METFGYLASAFMGLTLGMMGAGGSILTVPILVYLFAIGPVQATTYSLFIVGVTALVGALSSFRKGDVDLRTAGFFAIPSFVGVVTTRTLVMPRLPDPMFALGAVVVSKAVFIMAAFALLMVLAARAMLRPRSAASRLDAGTVPALGARIALKGLSVGIVTGFVGAGGGFLIIPALVVLVGLPMKKAVGTSLVIIAANSLIGFASAAPQHSGIDWRLLATISFIALTGLGAGSLLASRIPDLVLKKVFGLFVLVMGLFVLGDQIRSAVG